MVSALQSKLVCRTSGVVDLIFPKQMSSFVLDHRRVGRLRAMEGWYLMCLCTFTG